MDILQNILEDVFTKEFMWEKILRFQTKNGMRTDVVEALKEMRIPLLRWPGGCFADEYHWMDGSVRKKTERK